MAFEMRYLPTPPPLLPRTDSPPLHPQAIFFHKEKTEIRAIIGKRASILRESRWQDASARQGYAYCVGDSSVFLENPDFVPAVSLPLGSETQVLDPSSGQKLLCVAPSFLPPPICQ